MHRSALDWGGNLAAFAFVIALNVLSNTLPINGQTMPEISAKYPSLFTPAGFTFSIWGVIYLALLVFVVWQALPAQRTSETVARISKYFQLNCLMNGVWLIVWHYDLVALSLIVMLGILATLILIYRVLSAEIDASPMVQHLALHLPFSLYTGWITVATIANASVLQTANAWDDVGISAIQWTLLKLGIAGAVGVTLITRKGDVAFALAIAWAAYGISVMQSATPAVSGGATVLSLLLLILVARDGASRVGKLLSE